MNSEHNSYRAINTVKIISHCENSTVSVYFECIIYAIKTRKSKYEFMKSFKKCGKVYNVIHRDT